MRKIVFYPVVILALCCSVVLSQDEEAALLRYKFEPGQVWQAFDIIKGNMPMAQEFIPGDNVPAEMATNMPAGTTLNTTMDMTMIRLMTVNAVDENGVAAISMTIVSMLGNNTITTGDTTISIRMEFDNGTLTTSGPGNQQMPSQQLAMLEKLLNTQFNCTMDPLGGMEFGKSYEKLFGGMMGMMGMGNMNIDYRQLSRAAMGLPEHPVKIGDTWHNNYTAPAQSSQVVAISSQMTLVGISGPILEGGRLEGEHRVAHIKGTSYMKMAGLKMEPDKLPMMGAMIQGMQMNIDMLQATSNMDLNMDLDLGQMTKASVDTTLNMAQSIFMDLGAMSGGEQQGTMEIKTTIRNAKIHQESTTTLCAMPTEVPPAQ